MNHNQIDRISYRAAQLLAARDTLIAGPIWPCPPSSRCRCSPCRRQDARGDAVLSTDGSTKLLLLLRSTVVFHSRAQGMHCCALHSNAFSERRTRWY